MSAPSPRAQRLHEEDRPALETWFATQPDVTLFQAANLERAGFADDGRAYGGTWAGCFESGRLVAVAQHAWNGMVVLAGSTVSVAQAAEAEPNAAHHALTRLQAVWPDDVVIVTQNVDGLHEKAGSAAIHMHGALTRALCAKCDARWDAPAQMCRHDRCPHCGTAATRPDIVWFGEMPYHMDEIAAHLQTCAMFVAIGTSGQVYPAAGFVQEAALCGAATVEINMRDSDMSHAFDTHLKGPASKVVPQWVDRLLASA